MRPPPRRRWRRLSRSQGNKGVRRAVSEGRRYPSWAEGASINFLKQEHAWSMLETPRKLAVAAGSQCRRAECGRQGWRGYLGNYCSVSGKGRWVQLRRYFRVEFFCRGPFWMCPEHREFPLMASLCCTTYSLPVHLLVFSQNRDQVQLILLDSWSFGSL